MCGVDRAPPATIYFRYGLYDGKTPNMIETYARANDDKPIFIPYKSIRLRPATIQKRKPSPIHSYKRKRELRPSNHKRDLNPPSQKNNNIGHLTSQWVWGYDLSNCSIRRFLEIIRHFLIELFYRLLRTTTRATRPRTASSTTTACPPGNTRRFSSYRSANC